MRFTTVAFIGFTFFSSLCSAEVLDYSQSGLIDDSLAYLYESRCPRRLSEFIEEASKDEHAAVTYVSLHKNSILDLGASRLRDQLWLLGKFPDLRELDISFNRIGPDGLPSFEPLLNRENFQFLNIVGNSAASIDSGPYFRQLSPRHLGKLIWISEKHLDAKGWITLLRGRDDQESIIPCVEAIHRQYYAAKKKEVLEGLSEPFDIEDHNPERDLLVSAPEDEVGELKRIYSQACGGDAAAANTLGVSYWRSHSVKEDLKKALKWFNYAVSLSNVNALFNRGVIRKEMGELEAGMRDVEAAAEKYHHSAREMMGWEGNTSDDDQA